MTDTPDATRAAVEQRFAQVARSPGQEKKFPVGPASARKLGYDPAEIGALPASVTESFSGVGNPLGLGDPLPRPGQRAGPGQPARRSQGGAAELSPLVPPIADSPALGYNPP